VKIFTLAHLLALLAATQLNAQTSFFEGKTIRIIVDCRQATPTTFTHVYWQLTWASIFLAIPISWFRICPVRRA